MAVDYFLKIDGIEGESGDSKHKNEIQLLSWSWGESNQGSHNTGTGGGAGKVNMQDISFSMGINKASPKLMLACANGEHIKKAVLTCRKQGKEQQEYLQYTFEDLLVSSFQTGGHEGEVIPVEQVSLNFTKIKMTYKAQKADGTLDGGINFHWDLKANKGGA